VGQLSGHNECRLFSLPKKKMLGGVEEEAALASAICAH